MLREGVVEAGVGDRSGVEWSCGRLWFGLRVPRQRAGFADDRFPQPLQFKYTNHEGDLPPMDRPQRGALKREWKAVATAIAATVQRYSGECMRNAFLPAIPTRQ